MRDDLFPLTKDERRQALAAWRRVRFQDRQEACRLAERGIRAPDDYVSWAARGYGQYLLQRNVTNRMPRWAVPLAGLLVAGVGAVLGIWFDAGLGAGLVVVPSGLAVAVCGFAVPGSAAGSPRADRREPGNGDCSGGIALPVAAGVAPWRRQSKLPEPSWR
jgi:hypothetical protein